MTAQDLIARLQLVPHVEGGDDFSGADCWGICVLWYKHHLGIVLENRSDFKPGPAGVSAGAEEKTDFVNVDRPQDNDLVVMRAAIGGEVFQAGHIGVFVAGNLLHSDRNIGCVYQSVEARMIKSRVTGYLRHERFI